MTAASVTSPQNNLKQRRIGLTGGIATGKTTVSEYLAQQYRLPILDADHYARQVVEPGSPVLVSIVQRYGHGMLRQDGTLDRPQLGQIIFQDVEERRWLEAQIHPLVQQCFEQTLRELAEEPIVVLAIPLLFETGYHLTPLVTETWVVSCTLQQQCDRLMQRNSLTLQDAQTRIEAQYPLSDKCALADWVLDNSSSVAKLHRQIDRALGNWAL
ncbi:MAG: dephospho-CoA kinase [Prochlorotrichaceae cyanobacterium]